MAIQDMLQGIADRMSAIATVSTVFGEARVMNGRAIIPVALVCGGFGGGGGEGKCPPTEVSEQKMCQEGSGGGGGGGFTVRPLAVLEVTDGGTKLIPILDVTKIVLASLGFMGGMMWMIGKRRARAERKRIC
jgi:uncharacterized spore protein YtfJ